MPETVFDLFNDLWLEMRERGHYSLFLPHPICKVKKRQVPFASEFETIFTVTILIQNGGYTFQFGNRGTVF